VGGWVERRRGREGMAEGAGLGGGWADKGERERRKENRSVGVGYVGAGGLRRGGEGGGTG